MSEEEKKSEKPKIDTKVLEDIVSAEEIMKITDPKMRREITEQSAQEVMGAIIKKYGAMEPIDESKFEGYFNEVATTFLESKGFIIKKKITDAKYYLRMAGKMLREMLSDEQYSQLRRAALHGETSEVATILGHVTKADWDHYLEETARSARGMTYEKIGEVAGNLAKMVGGIGKKFIDKFKRNPMEGINYAIQHQALQEQYK